MWVGADGSVGSGRLGLRSWLDGVGRVDRKGVATRGDAGGADHAAGWDGSPGPG
jgi:hypothetical protein